MSTNVKTFPQQVVPCPERVTISGELAMQLKDYIGNSPCPALPVMAAVKLIGGLELELQLKPLL